MKIAITGATGFIGRHVRNAFAKTEHDVVLVVRDAEKVRNKFVHEEIVLVDLSQVQNDWFELLGKPDALLHMAWGGLPNYMDNYHVEVELPMQARFLTAIVNAGLKKLVVTGTCYEYGLSSGALTENQETNPNTPYGVAKDNLRRELFNLQSMKNFDLTWTRIFYPYGEGQSRYSLFSLIKEAANSCRPELLLSNSDSALDFISVIELGDILTALATSFKDVGILNLGSGRATSVIEFAQSLANRNNWSVNFRADPAHSRIFESKCFWSNSSKLTKLLGGNQKSIRDLNL
jgi:nucleoside-diphosphate-sugar epimerase